ncbi:XdhC family protein [Dyella aluminiiresistens]|uniref:XdhC family protein n=1 Tax=Dyella aluminiiresistens TaxID=3069105 RepID=UPI00399C9B03
MEVIDHGAPRVVRYDDASGLDVLMEMGCGGELEVHIEPLDGSADFACVDAMARGLGQRRAGVVATVFARDGEACRARQALWHDDELVHDGFADAGLLEAVARLARTPPARPASHLVETAAGRFDVLIETLSPPLALAVIGYSTVAQSLLQQAEVLGWSTLLVDYDAERLQGLALSDGVRRVCAQPGALADAMSLDAGTAVVVMTHNLQKDIDYVAALNAQPLAYLGLLGARKRVRRVIEEAGVPEQGIRGPAGLDIGSESPAEIALAIVAEILAVTRQRQGLPLRELSGSIH